MPLIRSGTGFQPDTHATHDGSARDFLGAQQGTPGGPVRFLASIGGVGDQQQTESCVGWSFVECIALRAAALGLSLPRGSELGVRNLALELELVALGTPGLALTDRGAQPSLAVQGIRQFGLPSQAAFPFDPAQAARRLGLGDLESADKTVPLFVKGFYGITDDGDARITQIRQALAADIPVALAVYSGSAAFQAPNDPDMNPTSRGIIGAPLSYRSPDHMVELVDVRDGDQGAEFLILNHWGRQWGTDGLAWCDESLVQVSSALYVIDIEAKP